MMAIKICFRCKVEKPHDGFSPDKRNPDGLQGTCKECCNKKRQNRYANDEEYQYKCKQRQRERGYLDKANERAKGGVKILSDTYVIASLKRGTTLNTEDIKEYPELIALKRLIIQQNRLKNGKKKKDS